MLRKRASFSDTKSSEAEISLPLTPAQAIKQYKDQLSMYELAEILDYSKIYFLGLSAAKIKASSNSNNFGFDDEEGDLNTIIGYHLSYRFEILQVIGKGSFGKVLKCYDYKNKQMCAIKVIKNKKRFHHQAAVELKILSHIIKKDPEDKFCLIHLKENFVFRKHLCLVFDILSGNLYEILKSNSFQGLPLNLVRNITIQLLTSLKFLNQERIIHCDLKPENILLVKPYKSLIKLIDFGSSCFEHERLYTYIQSRFYRAPEVILGISYKMSIDMWSLGCIIAELIIGYPLFPGENEYEQLLCIMEMLGLPPSHMIEACSKKNEYFCNGDAIVVPNSHGRIRNPGTRNINDKLNKWKLTLTF